VGGGSIQIRMLAGISVVRSACSIDLHMEPFIKLSIFWCAFQASVP
jgi:hypothetical protein